VHGSGLELVGHELAAACADASRVNLLRGALADRARQVSVID
jgi:hypothetical protein